ncbi:large subunit GTPase 1, partial [Dissostichus eleginoides]
ITGKLLYCHPPPHINPEDFQPQHSEFLKTDVDFSEFSSTSTSHNKVRRIENVVDKNFFHQANVRALSKGVQSVMGYKPGCGPVPAPKPGTEVVEGKPWKKHGNRNKKEKVRRLNRHLEA